MYKGKEEKNAVSVEVLLTQGSSLIIIQPSQINLQTPCKAVKQKMMIITITVLITITAVQITAYNRIYFGICQSKQQFL